MGNPIFLISEPEETEAEFPWVEHDYPSPGDGLFRSRECTSGSGHALAQNLPADRGEFAFSTEEGEGPPRFFTSPLQMSPATAKL